MGDGATSTLTFVSSRFPPSPRPASSPALSFVRHPLARRHPTTMKVEFCNFSGYKIYPGKVRPSLPLARLRAPVLDGLE